jgi:hypothetical protein
MCNNTNSVADHLDDTARQDLLLDSRSLASAGGTRNVSRRSNSSKRTNVTFLPQNRTSKKSRNLLHLSPPILILSLANVALCNHYLTRPI